MKNIIWALLISLFVGILAFVCELFVFVVILSKPMNLYAQLFNFRIYLIFYVYVGIFLWVLGMICDVLPVGVFKKTNKKNFYLISSAFLTIMIIVIGEWVNVFFLPRFFSVQALASNGAIFLVVLLIFLRINQYVYRKKMRFRNLATAPAAILCILSSFLVFTTLAKGRSGNGMPGPQRKTDRLNVVVILVDALRPDHLSCYGYHRKTSPTIDNLASEGVVFNKVFAQSTYTFESVTSMLTSQYPPALNIKFFVNTLPEGSPTIFQILNEDGFTTAIFSEHGYLSNRFGWDETYGVDINYAPCFKSWGPKMSLHYALERVGIRGNRVMEGMVDFSANIESRILAALKITDRPVNKNKKLNVVRRFITFLEEEKEKPFFAYFHLMGPHAPYDTPPPYENAFRQHAEGKKISVLGLNKGHFPFEDGSQVSDEQLRDIIDRYDEEILYTDRGQIAKIIDSLTKKDLLQRTLVIVTADHGEQFYEHKQWLHGNTAFHSVIHVPLVIRAPGIAIKNRSIDEVVELVDVAPTILDLCGIERPSHIEGKSLIPLLRGEEWIPKSAYSERGTSRHTFFTQSLIKDDLHLILVKFKSRKKLMLFDFHKDPHELDDISNENIEKTGQMYAQLMEIYENSKKKAKIPTAIIPDKDLKAHFSSLGYLQ